MKNDIFFSVVILTLRCSSYIRQCLTSVLSQNFLEGRYEVIAVDGGSKDGTLEILAQFPNVRTINFLHERIAQARNKGAQESRGEVLAFIDGDCVADRFWLAKAYSYFQESKDILVGGKVDVPADGFWIERCWALHREFSWTKRQIRLEDKYGMKQAVATANIIGTANLFIGKTIFDKIGGFNDALLAGEDTLLCHRLVEDKYKLYYDERIKVTHLREPKTIKAFFSQHLLYGREGGRQKILFAKNGGLDLGLFFSFLSIFFLVFLVISFLFFVIYSSWLLLKVIVGMYFITIVCMTGVVFYKTKKKLSWGLFLLYPLYGLARGLNLIPLIKIRKRKN